MSETTGPRRYPRPTVAFHERLRAAAGGRCQMYLAALEVAMFPDPRSHRAPESGGPPPCRRTMLRELRRRGGWVDPDGMAHWSDDAMNPLRRCGNCRAKVYSTAGSCRRCGDPLCDQCRRRGVRLCIVCGGEQ